MKVLVTAGPTREKIDAVRFLTNRSTGKMGYALAEAARDAGHEVTLVSGPVALAVPHGITLVPVESAAEMAEAVKERAPQMALVIMCAGRRGLPSETGRRRENEEAGGRSRA